MLFESSSLVSQRHKYMMIFETVMAQSKCQKCVDIHAASMKDIGITEELLKELNQDISDSKMLDDETKNLVIFTLYIASFDSRTRDQLDTKMLEGFTKLMGQKKITRNHNDCSDEQDNAGFYTSQSFGALVNLAPSSNEVVEKTKAHAKQAHGMNEVPNDLAKKLMAAIQPA